MARRDPVAIVDLYCTKELSIPAMDQTVADSAFTRAEKLIMVGLYKLQNILRDQFQNLESQQHNGLS